MDKFELDGVTLGKIALEKFELADGMLDKLGLDRLELIELELELDDPGFDPPASVPTTQFPITYKEANNQELTWVPTNIVPVFTKFT